MSRHIDVLRALIPAGLFDFTPGTVVFAEYGTIALMVDAVEDQVAAVLAELDPRTAEVLLARWEAVLVLRAKDRSTAERQARVLAALRLIPDFRPLTIQTRMSEFTLVDWVITEPGPFLFDDPGSLFDTTDDVLDGAHVFVLTADHDDVVAAGLYRPDLLAFLGRLKPAHTLGQVRVEGAFLFDDPWSLFDLDLLGA